MEESGKSTPGAQVTVWSADRNTKICFTCPCDLNSVKRKGCDKLFGSDVGCENIKVVREDEGTECADDGVLYHWVVQREYRLQLLRLGEIWEPTSATPGEILKREMSLKEEQHKIREREMSLQEKQYKILERKMSLKEVQERRRRINNNVFGIAATGGSVALAGAGIAACCVCPPLAAVGILVGVGGSTFTAGSVGYCLTSSPQR